jgi:hypothetical protein
MMLGPLDIRLAADGDIDLSDGAASLVGWDAEGLAQRVQTRLRLQLGEHALNVKLGVPWLQEVLVKGTGAQAAGAVLRRQILSVPGITSLDTFEASLDYTTRTLTFSFRALYRPAADGMEDAEDDIYAIVGEGDFGDGELDLLCLVEGVGGYL